MIVLIIVLLSILGGFLYNFGGLSKEEGKQTYPIIPQWMFNTNTRDVGVSFLTTICLYLLGIHSWLLILSFFLLMMALKTYWDFLFKNKDNFFIHGLMCGVSLLPLFWYPINWVMIVVRAILLGLFMGIWHKFITKAHREERGRGYAIILSSLLLKI